MEVSTKKLDKQIEKSPVSQPSANKGSSNLTRVLVIWAMMQAGLWCFGLFVVNIVLPGVLGEESTAPDGGDGLMDFWIVRLLTNLMGYATIFVPGYLLIRYFRNVRFNETGGNGSVGQLVKLCVFGKDAERISLEEGPLHTSAKGDSEKEKTFMQKAIVLSLCFLGLQGSYLTWGILQERIMTYEYGKTETSSVFIAMFLRIYANHRQKDIARRRQAAATSDISKI
ncbi:hypothetical protein ScPMuIL_013986 [Solemya velum]